ncbi:hypothetical protein ACFVVU_02830 [Kitasatospora sp. NPDC057965]|uniref:hypothetical protein n=1 Tax=Kitasatospora sp. NPDC057965 TaxID=3346291 RepID=UPI0036D7A4B6
MTVSRSPAELAAAYAQPPYRMPSPPPREGHQLVLDVLLPWRLASRVYGPYRMMRLTASGVTAAVGADVLGPYAQPVVTRAAAQTLDPVVERLLTPRALLGLGIVLFLVRTVTGTWTSGDLLIELIGEDSVVMLLTGPIALLLACVPLVLLAYPGTRRQVGRLVARPLLVGVFTAVVFVVMMRSALLPLAGVLLLWLAPFNLCVLYLVHRNSFAVRAHPLVRPLVATLLVWLTALGHVLFVDRDGTSTHGAALVALVAGPVGVTVTAVIEIVLLRRRHGVGFRGPLGPLGPLGLPGPLDAAGSSGPAGS